MDGLPVCVPRTGRQEAKYKVHLANPAEMQQYSGLKYTDDKWDSYWLAHMLRLGILPEGRSGYFQDMKLFPTKSGTPQGGILSPTLANMTLDGLEEVVKKSCPSRRKVNFIRYADDFIVTADSRELLENNIIPAINSFLKTRGLKLSEEKTRIVRIEQGFDFLGQHLQKFRNKLITTPSKENSKSFLDKVRSVIKKCYG